MSAALIAACVGVGLRDHADQLAALLVSAASTPAATQARSSSSGSEGGSPQAASAIRTTLTVHSMSE